MSSLSFVVVLRNEEDNLPPLLSSIEKEILEEFASEFEFLFIDNDSSDSSLEILEQWKKRRGSAVRIIKRNKNNLGEARQQALEEAKTPWLVFVDGDTTLSPFWGRNITKLLADLPSNVVAVGGGEEYSQSQPWHTFVLPLANYFPLGKKGKQRVEVEHVPSNNLLVLVEAARSVGGFDGIFSRVGEDLDFTVRLRDRGLLLYDPIFSIHHKLPKTQSAWFEKMALYGRAQSFVFLKYGGQIPGAKFLPLLMVLSTPLAVAFFPLSCMAVVFLAILSHRIRFLSLSFLFYGLGELIGGIYGLFRIALFSRLFYDDRLVTQSRE